MAHIFQYNSRQQQNCRIEKLNCLPVISLEHLNNNLSLLAGNTPKPLRQSHAENRTLVATVAEKINRTAVKISCRWQISTKRYGETDRRSLRA